MDEEKIYEPILAERNRQQSLITHLHLPVVQPLILKMSVKHRQRVLLAIDWYEPKIHEGMARYARKHDWLLNSHMTRSHQFPEGWEGDGVIALLSEPETAKAVRSLGLPVVNTGSDFWNFPRVWCDNHRVGEIAAQHFLERNHRNFAFLHIQSTVLERETSEGFSLALEKAGFTCEMRRWRPSLHPHAINYRAVQEWAVAELMSLPRPLAVFCQNDDAAAIILTAAVEAGIRIPEEVAIIGVGDSELVANFLPVKLSSVNANSEGLGYRACEELDRLMRGHKPRAEVVRVSPLGVTTRESTDFLAVADPHVLRVLRRIWDEYATPLDVEELTRMVPLSRSALYKLFAAEVGQPIAKELMRVRIRHAKEALRTTNRPVSTIASECGFSGLITFSRAFSNTVGISPMQYRMKHVRGDSSASTPDNK